MSRKNIKLPAEVFERHNERREELGLSWAEYIDGQHPLVTESEFREILREELDRI